MSRANRLDWERALGEKFADASEEDLRAHIERMEFEIKENQKWLEGIARLRRVMTVTGK